MTKNGEFEALRESAISRRAMLRGGLCGAAGLLLGDRLGLPSPVAFGAPADSSTGPATAKSVIQIWMWGGPSHLDTFDPKPAAGTDYCGPLNNPIETNVKDIRIGELLPELAKQADKYSIIRSMTHGINAHETATYLVQTGRMPGEAILYPSVGAVVSYFKGYEAGYDGMIPPYIVLTKPQGRFLGGGLSGGNATSPSPPAATRPRTRSPWKAWWSRGSPAGDSASVGSSFASWICLAGRCPTVRNWQRCESAKIKRTT